MTNLRGVFTLRTVRRKKLLGTWVDLDNVWISPSLFLGLPPNTGYFGGGIPGPYSLMDKVTYSSDTTAAVPGANLSVARAYLAASSARANGLPETGFFPSPVIV